MVYVRNQFVFLDVRSEGLGCNHSHQLVPIFTSRLLALAVKWKWSGGRSLHSFWTPQLKPGAQDHIWPRTTLGGFKMAGQRTSIFWSSRLRMKLEAKMISHFRDFIIWLIQLGKHITWADLYLVTCFGGQGKHCIIINNKPQLHHTCKVWLQELV